MSVPAGRKAEVIKTYAKKPGDTGSPEVQVAILPWRSNLALLQEAILIGSCQIAGRACRCRLNRANASGASAARNA